MARPFKNNAEYFSHDADMRNDKEIRAIRKKFGHTGYAVYNMLLEVLTDCENFKLNWNDRERKLVAADFDLEEDQFQHIIEEMLDINLIQIDEGYLRCNTLEKRFEKMLSKRYRERQTLSQIKPDENEVIVPETTQSKVKNSKVNKSIEEKSTVNFHELYLYKNYDKLKQELLTPGSMLDALMMAHKITLKEVTDYIDKFIDKMRYDYPGGRTLKENRQHLNNWIGAEIKKGARDASGKPRKDFTYNEVVDMITKGQAKSIEDSFIRLDKDKYRLR